MKKIKVKPEKPQNSFWTQSHPKSDNKKRETLPHVSCFFKKLIVCQKHFKCKIDI